MDITTMDEAVKLDKLKPATNGVGKGIGVLHCTLHGGRTVLRLQSRGQWCYQARALVLEVL